MYNHSVYKTLSLSVFLAGIFLLAGLLFSPGVEAAKSTEHARCLDGAGELNAVLFVRFRDASSGAVIGYSNDFSFGVTAVREGKYSGATSDADVDTYDGEYNKNTIARFDGGNFGAYGPSQTFTAKRAANGTIAKNQGQLCDPDNNAGGKVLAYAFRSGDGSTYFPGMGVPSIGYNDNNGSMSLSCLHKPNIGFRFNYGGVNDKPAGRTLVSTSIVTSTSAGIRVVGSKNAVPDPSVTYIFGIGPTGTVNDDQARIYYDMYFSSPPPPTITPYGSLNLPSPGSEAEAGSSVAPTAGVNNNSTAGVTATSNYTRTLWYENSTTDQVYNSGDVLIASRGPSIRTYVPGDNTDITAPSSGAWNFTIPLNTNHRFICQSITLQGPVTPAGTTISPPTGTVTQCAKIVRKPYFQVMNGDLSSACTTSAIKGFWNTAVSNGSGAEIGVYAGAPVTEFVSALKRGTTPTRPKGLTFANTIAADTYGSAVSAGLTNCASLSSGGSGVTIAGPISGVTDSILASHASGVINDVLYVNGDLRIGGNITYAGTSGLSLGSLPYFKVVVSGNIYIGPGVSEINGIYQAVGKIYTCTNSAMGAPTSPVDIDPACFTNRLTVNGALRASGVKYLRLVGTTLTLNQPAETVLYDPLVWLHALSGASGPSGGTSSGTFDAYTTLPPVL